MQKQYEQLTLEERELIQEMVWAKESMRAIGRRLGRSPSTISRELERNTPQSRRQYTPRVAQEKYQHRKRIVRQRPRLKNPAIVKYVHRKLKKDWSPEQIAGRWNRTHKKLKISHEAIYQYIYTLNKPGDNGDLRPLLRRKHKRRNRKKVPFKTAKTTILNRISIELRPKEVEARRIVGHWEGDSIVSRKSLAVLNTLVERKTKMVKITKLNRKTAQETSGAVIKRLHQYPKRVRKTLTLDNGTENAGHEYIAKEIGLKCFFAHTYSSCERGTNENTNGLIRYYFPKGTDFAKVSERDIKRVENILNNRPRKALKYLTPIEAFKRSVALTY